MTATTRLRRLRISILVAVLLAAQMLAVTHAIAHVLHEPTGKCFVCHSADNFKHFTVAPGVEVVAPIALQALLPRATTQPTYPAARAFFARGPPPDSI